MLATVGKCVLELILIGPDERELVVTQSHALVVLNYAQHGGNKFGGAFAACSAAFAGTWYGYFRKRTY
jgi:hypothetical protein